MKTITTLFVILCCYSSSFSQEKDVDTYSSTIDGLNNLIVENFDSSLEGQDALNKNLVFLFEVSKGNLGYENKIKLKQSFRLLSNRLTEDDMISLLVFSGKNGIVLKQTSVKDLKTILAVIESFGENVKEFNTSGITLAYDFIHEYYDEDGENAIVIVRNPTIEETIASSSEQSKNPTKTNKFLITAIGLLPEIIALIKD